jgi:hypothetical protein
VEVVEVRIWHIAVFIGGCFIMAVPEGLDSCGIAPPSPVFSVSQGPANFEGEFLKGKLGVLQRTFHQRYLIGAFRILKGLPLTEEEIGSMYPPPAKTHVPPDPTPGYDAWNEVREKFNGPPKAPSDPYRAIMNRGSLYELTNCHDDAYAKAADTLVDLQQRWGIGDPRTAEWTKAQDVVFGNCSGPQKLPEPPTPSMDKLLAAHRNYQIGAAY